jgi:hypothetical protein
VWPSGRLTSAISTAAGTGGRLNGVSGIQSGTSVSAAGMDGGDLSRRAARRSMMASSGDKDAPDYGSEAGG